MIIHQLVILYFILNYISYCNCAENATCTDLKVKNEKDGSEKNLMDFIKDGIKYIDENKGLVSKGVMVLGISGTGKSTLINYLIGRRLKCVMKKFKWILELVNQEVSLGIGHEIYSKTLYPEFVYLKDEDISFIDNPGFGDTRGDQIDIANVFFREYVAKKVENIKIIILLSFSDTVQGRGGQFRTSLKELERIFGVFESEQKNDPELEINLSESIAIVVTKVPFIDVENNLQILKNLQSILEEIIDDEFSKKNLNLFEANIYKRILSKTRIAIFSNPQKEVILDDTEKINILKMIRDMNYIKTEKLKIQRNISDSSFKLLKMLISDCSQSIENKLENTLYKNVSNLLKLDLAEECRKNNITKIKIIFETTSNFTEKCFKKLKFEHLLSSVPENILDFSSKQDFSNENRVLSFFTELVLTNPNQSISDDRVWLKIDLLSFTNQLVKNLKENLNNLLEKEELVLFEAIENSFESFINSSINNAFSSSDLGQCQSKLKHISNQIEFSSNASSIFENFNDEIIKASWKQTMIKISKFRTFLNVSDEIKNQNIKLKLKEIIYKQDSTLLEISSSKNSVSSDEDQLYFKSNFSTLSVICSQINVDRNVKLKTINVFLKYSLELDENCSIRRVIYSTHVPDLVIITPKLFVKKTISINLSCESTPENFKEKAKDGSFFGENGHDGEPGKPGYNGGRLFIFAESVKYANESKIEFISIGGNGGPGQDGGHGHDGRDGNKPRIMSCRKDNDIGHNCYHRLIACSFFSYYGWGLGKILDALKRNPSWNYDESDEKRKDELLIQDCINDQCTGLEILNRVDMKPGDKYTYVERGGDCTAGGSFGYGGDGGQPGLNGYLSIQTKEYKYTSNYTESYGANGKKGENGRKGKNGIRTNIWYRFFVHWLYYKEEMSDEEVPCFKYPKQKELKNHENASTFSELQFYKISNAYLDFFLKDYHFKKFKMENIINFIYEIENDQKIDINGLLQRVKMLKLFKSNNLLSEFRDQVQIYHTKASQINDNHNEIIVLEYINSLVNSYMSLLKTDHSSSVILDIGKYLDNTIKKIKNWKSFEIQKIIHLYKKNYEENLDVKIKESTKAIKYIEERIDVLTISLDKSIINILDEIANQTNEVKNNIDLLKEHKNQLERSLKVKAIFGFLKIFSGLLSIAGPKGALAGGILQTGLDIGQQISGNQLRFENTNIPPNIDSQVKDFKETIQKKLDAKKFDEDKAKKWRKRLNTLPPINSFILRGVDLISEKQINNQEIKEVVMKINENFKQLDGLREAENNLNTYYNDLREELNSLISFDNLNNKKSTIVLSLHSYNLKSNFTDLKKNLFILIDGFKNKLETEQIFQSLENSIDAIYEIFRQIETFRQQIKLGRYIERVTNKEKEFQITEKYQSEVNSMKTVLIENFIREAVKKSFQAFSFWSFPFYCDYLKKKTNNAELIQNDTNERMLIYEETINNIRSIVNDHEININFKIDNYLINFNFENESSLFKWSSRDFPFEVEQLFLGNFSSFYSNVKNSSYNAVKVSQIRISIECQSRKINHKLDEILRKFAVKMIHNGESNYRLLDKFYKFNSLTREQLELQYSYGCHLHSKCNLENESFRKLSNSKRPSISPYTFWRIKLVPKDKNPLKVNQKLHQLNSIFKEIDEPIIISLNGYGQYVNDEFNKHSNVNNCEGLNAIE